MQQTANQARESSAEISAASLLKLLTRAEASAVAPQSIASAPSVSSVYDASAKNLPLSPYHRELLETIAEAVFCRANEDFYAQYKGLGPEQIVQIVVSKDDLRPLAYRAMLYTDDIDESADLQSFHPPFAPRFAQSLLLLQKHWDAEFLQPFKDVAGKLSADSIKRGFGV